jgi:hypothetical protein
MAYGCPAPHYSFGNTIKPADERAAESTTKPTIKPADRISLCHKKANQSGSTYVADTVSIGPQSQRRLLCGYVIAK